MLADAHLVTPVRSFTGCKQPYILKLSVILHNSAPYDFENFKKIAMTLKTKNAQVIHLVLRHSSPINLPIMLNGVASQPRGAAA